MPPKIRKMNNKTVYRTLYSSNRNDINFNKQRMCHTKMQSVCRFMISETLKKVEIWINLDIKIGLKGRFLQLVNDDFRIILHLALLPNKI